MPREIRHCKIAKCYNKDERRLVFSLPLAINCAGRNTTLSSLVARLLVSSGLTRKTGVAPMGFLERQLSNVIGGKQSASS